MQKLAPSDAIPSDLNPLHLVVLLAEPAADPIPDQLPLFGIEDGVYLQHDDRPGLMTKREVRIQLLADLDLPAAGVLWDLGAGTGSVGLEALRLQPQLQLMAVERRSGGGRLIQANARRLGVQPAAVLEGDALSVLEKLPDPDRALGGGGRHPGAAAGGDRAHEAWRSGGDSDGHPGSRGGTAATAERSRLERVDATASELARDALGGGDAVVADEPGSGTQGRKPPPGASESTITHH